jgi:tRNA(adenine34) deaminase
LALPWRDREELFMKEAIAEGKKALALGEVPVGAVIVRDNDIISRGYNIKETLADPTGHAEIVAIRKAAAALGGWRLAGADLYVTIEPCPMCAGAIVQARLRRLFFGAADPKAGAAGSLLNLLQLKELNHQVEVTGGILEAECRQLMQDFFQTLRV